MMGIIFVVHGIVCFLLIAIILVQSGRGGGLIDSFSSMESVFGTKTSAFMTKLTSVLSVMFMLSCLTLALMSVHQSRSLMSNVQAKPAATKPAVQDKQAVPAGAENAGLPGSSAATAVSPAVSLPADPQQSAADVSAEVTSEGKAAAPETKAP